MERMVMVDKLWDGFFEEIEKIAERVSSKSMTKLTNTKFKPEAMKMTRPNDRVIKISDPPPKHWQTTPRM